MWVQLMTRRWSWGGAINYRCGCMDCGRLRGHRTSIQTSLLSLNFQSCVLDLCLCYRYQQGLLALICVYVDDIIIRTSDVQYMVEFKSRYLYRYDTTDNVVPVYPCDIGGYRCTTRLATIRGGGTAQACGTFWDRFQNIPSLPSNAKDMLVEDKGDYSPEQSDLVQTFPYRELVGATLYLAMHTRPDVAYAGVLSR